MDQFDTIDDLAVAIKDKLDLSTRKQRIVALYAFNSTGKTRLTNIINETERESGQEIDNEFEESGDAIKVLCYNAFLEDMFRWDNERYILFFDQNSWIIRLIIDQGLEGEIVNNFKNIVNSKVEPLFNFIDGGITFNIASGDDHGERNIKISKGEESALIWSIFCTVLKTVIDLLNIQETDRETHLFNELKYVIIDDPVSSIDDTKIITIAIDLIKTIQSCKNNSVKFLITTHHALFYNIIINSFKNNSDYKFEAYSLLKDDYILKLLRSGDSPFSYHLLVKDLIFKAIENGAIEKYHFNLFRNLLEKTAHFLGYSLWSDLLLEGDKDAFVRMLNLYSHSRLSELESRELASEDKQVFQEVFNNFITNFKWN